MSLNKDNLCKWVKALKSKKYQQTVNELRGHAQGEFCVLGVACDVYEKTTGDKVHYDKISNEVLPLKVKRWYGLSSKDPVIAVGVGKKQNRRMVRRPCSELNDDYDVTFKQFAPALAKNFGLNCKG